MSSHASNTLAFASTRQTNEATSFPAVIKPNGFSLNHLLAAIPDAEFNRLRPHLEFVQLRLGDILYESGGRL